MLFLKSCCLIGSSATTLQDVRLELTKEDAAAATNGIVSAHKMISTSFFVMGLELEDQQYVSKFSFLFASFLIIPSRRQLSLEITEVRKSPTPKQLADLEEKRTLLFHRIQRWRQVQLVYMPSVGVLLAANLTGDSEPTSGELVPLHLPSSLSPSLRESPSLATLITHEIRLRIAQAKDALADIRRQRRIISGSTLR